MSSKTCLLAIFGLLLCGCQAVGWQPIDGASGEASAIAEARKFCRVDAKLAGLERAAKERDEALRLSQTNESTMVARDDYDQIRRQVWREIDICMARRGYQRNG